MKKGIVLLAHGSRDPAWPQGIEAIAASLHEAHQPAVCAYVELSKPNLLEAVSTLQQQGCEAVDVVPMFLGLGQHARHDLPRLLSEAQDRFPEMHLDMQAALCDRPQFIAALSALLRPTC